MLLLMSDVYQPREYEHVPRTLDRLPPRRQGFGVGGVWKERFERAMKHPFIWTSIHTNERAKCAAQARNLRIRQFRTGHDGVRKGDTDRAVFITATRSITDDPERDFLSELYVLYLGTIEELTPLMGKAAAEVLDFWCLRLQHRPLIEAFASLMNKANNTEDPNEAAELRAKAVSVITDKIAELSRLTETTEVTETTEELTQPEDSTDA